MLLKSPFFLLVIQNSFRELWANAFETFKLSRSRRIYIDFCYLPRTPTVVPRRREAQKRERTSARDNEERIGM